MTELQNVHAPGDTTVFAEEHAASGVSVYTTGLLLASLLTAVSFWVANTSLISIFRI